MSAIVTAIRDIVRLFKRAHTEAYLMGYDHALRDVRAACDRLERKGPRRGGDRT